MQKDTLSTRPHWSKDADYSRVPFFIRRMNTRGRITVAEVPSASLPLVGFLYLTEGEVLAEVDGIQFLCESGHLLLIPEGRPPQDLPTYAAEAFVSPGHLNRTVKKATGKSVGAWIDIARLGMAKRLLRDTELPVSEVAVAVGLDDSSYFSRFFKLHVSLTPVAFRKKMHGLS